MIRAMEFMVVIQMSVTFRRLISAQDETAS